MLSKTYTKYIQSLHHKKSRDIEGVFIGEGTKVVLELLQSEKFECKTLFCTYNWEVQYKSTVKKNYKEPIQVITDIELEKISALSTPNEVLAIFSKSTTEKVAAKGKINLMLDTIQDPGNLGTIIRIADWFGIENIICSKNTTEMYNPKVVQSTMGSLSRVNIIYTDLVDWIDKNDDIKVYAAALDGKKVNEIKDLKEGIILIGNESKGISAELMNIAFEKITIPKIGEAESLNAAVATGIILSHII
ncbi:RNA methyltransferase [Ferruginibacter lapsinanis]|uniref:TrmH family RNA methyltransferase n=1 Tax=Ferruginibacter lapsinanis TaxID=563172 RepID=UPI001E42D6E9|nr:RNA methyltransferase [Ferruginibacter lapsinanis]UEG49329.1 RNA methyltransferase [Ferruginibacter lapsinanis]